MRSLIIALTAIAMLLAETPAPHKIALARVYPQPGQLSLFVAASDGRDEHLLLASALITTRSGLRTADLSSSPPNETDRLTFSESIRMAAD